MVSELFDKKLRSAAFVSKELFKEPFAISRVTLA